MQATVERFQRHTRETHHLERSLPRHHDQADQVRRGLDFIEILMKILIETGT